MKSAVNHVMCDLETLGTVPGCIAFSIGMVEFFPDSGQLGRTFYRVVDVESCAEVYLREDEDTKAWWAKQSASAKVTLTQARSGDGVPLKEALEELNDFFAELGGLRSIRLYGNGADFDNSILRVMYDAAGVPFLGSKAGFFGGRCYRTLKNLNELLGPEFGFGKLTEDMRQGTYHNALDDARSQAIHLMDNIARIRQALKKGE